MRLSIRHVTAYEYDPPANSVALRLRLYPSQFDAQTPIEWEVRVNDEPAPPLLTTGFGDGEGQFVSQSRIERLEIVAEGVVETTDASGVVRGLSRTPPPGVFLRATPLTEPDEAVRSLGAAAARDDALEAAHALCAAVRDALDYEPAQTHALTSAAEALKHGAGVCQDHAHVFVAAARARGRPARYVAGYLLHADDGEVSETHAWAEAYIDGLGWVGFDPANRMCPTDRYVRLGCGLDARDAAPIRGAVGAPGEQKLSAYVEIQPAAAQQQSQTQEPPSP